MLLRSSIFILFLLAISVAGKAQGAEELEKRNGFKDIKLMSAVSSYEGLVLKKETEHERYKTVGIYKAKKGFYETIGTLNIKELEVKTYKGGIFQIFVLVEKDPKLYRGLKKSFGPPEFSLRGQTYYWATPKLKLSFRSHDKNSVELVYYSYLMEKELDEEKKQEIDDISSDF